jgi:hypothetical protein
MVKEDIILSKIAMKIKPKGKRLRTCSMNRARMNWKGQTRMETWTSQEDTR